MTRITRSLLSAVLLAFAAVPACTDAGTGSNTAASTSGRVSMQVIVTGDTSSSLDLTATDAATGAVALADHFTIAADGSVAATVELPEGDYSFTLTAYAEDGVTATASGAADVTIAAQTTINFNATLDVEGGLETVIGNPPAIGTIGVSVISDLHLGLSALGDATLSASVTDADGDGLTFFWSGTGIDGSIAGGSSLSIDNDAMVQARLHGQLDVNVGAQFVLVAQDSHGGAAVAQITIGSNATCLLCGAARVEIVAGADIGIEEVGDQLEACLSAQVACSASCNAAFAAGDGSVEAAASCRAECGADLAACAGN